VFFFARRLTRPLERIAGSAAEMAGLPQEAVAEGGGMRELEALSASITGRGTQIAATERTRRDFIANLSHELRSPMTSIQGFIRGVLDGTVPEADRERTLGVVLEETRRMNRLVSGLLDLSRAEAGQPRETHAPFNVCEVARRAAITKGGRREEKRLNLHTDFERDEIYAMGVADQIEQVLINLVDNAIRFTPEGGNIHIGIREQGELVEVTVRDDGIGVAPQDAERVFERFYTGSPAHTAGEGVGLGLAISKAIIEQHGQTIRLLPDGPGAAFRFTLRKAAKPAAKHHAGQEGDKSNGNQHDH
ncbi:MAG TPA: HAMP domain-containing sensor histidine kinase, partial [Candidatus Limnocylindria bacterium]|nr:HAMP domain-containing sensor histidine kinase [Candidatus Limnocylindria bacterium]